MVGAADLRGDLGRRNWQVRDFPLSVTLPPPPVAFSGPGAAPVGSWRSQRGADATEQVLRRVVGAEVKPELGELGHDDRADLDKLRADRRAGRLRECGSAQGDSAQRFHQAVSQRREQHPPLVGPPPIGAEERVACPRDERAGEIGTTAPTSMTATEFGPTCRFNCIQYGISLISILLCLL